MSFLAARRRSPLALLVLIFLGLAFTGTAYAAMQANVPPGTSSEGATEEQLAEGRQLFLGNCASCHGANAEGNGSAGPSLHGVGAAAVDFQVATGRMPLPAPDVQAERNISQVKFSDEEITSLAVYIDSLAPGPDVPEAQWLDVSQGDPAAGGAVYRTNCAMCHNSSGTGGALTRGKYAPTLMGVEPQHIYEAMLTGPQSMPVFNDQNITPEEKRDVIAFLKSVEDGANDQGGHTLGSLGPAGDALFAWTIGILAFIGAAVWLGRKAA
ncbi:ubiquinol cytochrome C oxidoreductase, cytochrome C1 subunit [Serinicoccus hydrothermalis]|uniref:Cytochrome bc1 complex cytochrome c subunit n=1 Tax=Serinicoccus hydrothermalis TaxID=1758689 RepID=A0A1B1N9U3_9MICO|nr:c-type cytochrome [Serinicoccus hydrothermalis]ANS78220.1 ubiquinol cytochrome C oxidoreductase, cytochrome C1 subunit [Serinicoccus hydrothermalis]